MQITTTRSPRQGRGHFRPELLPPASSFYKREFRKLSRPSRGWSRTACTIHGGDNPTALSVNLQHGGFYCHSCGAHGGDVLAFTMQRYQMSFQDAAKELGAWDSTNEITATQIRELQKERDRRRQIEEQALEDARLARVSECHWLHILERSYRFANRRLSEIQRGAAESFEGERETCWAIMADALPQIREADAAYRRLAGLEAKA